MATSREAHLDAQLEKHTARRLIDLLRDEPRDAYFDSVSRVLQAREDRAIAVEAQLTFLTIVLRDLHADEHAESSAALPAIAEDGATSEIHAPLVVLALDQTGPADLGTTALSSRCNQAFPVEGSLKMVPREKDVPFKKRKWAMVEDGEEIFPLQPAQEVEPQEGCLAHGSPVPVKRIKADDVRPIKRKMKWVPPAAAAALVVHDEIVPVPLIQIAASPPRICDKPCASQPSKDPWLLQEAEVHEGDSANRLAISLKRKSDAVVEVGEDVVAPIQISKEPGEETMMAMGVALPFKKRSRFAVVEDDDELLLLQPIKDSGLIQEEDVREGNLSNGSPVPLKSNADAVVVENEVSEDVVAVEPIQISKETEEETMVAKVVALPFKKRSTYMLAVVQDEDELLPLQPMKNSGLIQEEEIQEGNLADPVGDNEVSEEDAVPPEQIPKELEEESRVVATEDAPQVKEGLSNVQPWEPTSSCHSQSQLISESERVACASLEEESVVDAGLEEKGDKRERGLPSEATQEEVAEETEHLVQQEIMEEEVPSEATQEEVAQETEHLMQHEIMEEEVPNEATREQVAEDTEHLVQQEIMEEEVPSEATQEVVVEETAHLVQQEIMEEEESPVAVRLYPGGDSLMADTPSDISSSWAPELEQTSDSDTVTVGKKGRGRGRGGKKKKKQAKKKGAGQSSRGRGHGLGRDRKPSSEAGCRCWLIAPEAFPVAVEDDWLRRLTQDKNGSEEGERDGSSTSALTVLASASLMRTDASDTEWLPYTQVQSNPNGEERDGTMEEEENEAPALSVLAGAALVVADARGTRNDVPSREECSARAIQRIRMEVNINGEGSTSPEGANTGNK